MPVAAPVPGASALAMVHSATHSSHSATAPPPPPPYGQMVSAPLRAHELRYEDDDDGDLRQDVDERGSALAAESLAALLADMEATTQKAVQQARALGSLDDEDEGGEGEAC